LSPLSRHNKYITRNSKGVSGILATIFLVIIVIFLYSQVFIFMQNENTRFEAGAREANQMDVDLSLEKLSFSNLSYLIEGGNVHLQTQVTNEGPVSVELVTLWIVDSSTQNYGYNDTVNIFLDVGETMDLTGSNGPVVSITGLSSSSKFSSWFITARGNRITIETHILDVVVANVATGLGAIGLNFDEFKYFTYETTTKLANFSDGTVGFDVPKGTYVAYGCYLTNYDPQKRLVTIDSHSLLFQPGRTGVGEGNWFITNVDTDGSILSLTQSSFTDITLNYGEEKLIIFASANDIGGADFARLKTDNVPNGATVSTSLLLHGTIGSVPFAQNVPFVALFYN
jgi:hypothetical protein